MGSSSRVSGYVFFKIDYGALGRSIRNTVYEQHDPSNAFDKFINILTQAVLGSKRRKNKLETNIIKRYAHTHSMCMKV